MLVGQLTRLDWMVHEDITDNFSWISTEKRGLQTIPTSGWEYADGGKFVGGDDTLQFIYIKLLHMLNIRAHLSF